MAARPGGPGPRFQRLLHGRRRSMAALTVAALTALTVQAPAAHAAGDPFPFVDLARVTAGPYLSYAADGIMNLTGNADPLEPPLATPATVTAVAGTSGAQAAPILRSDLDGSTLASVPVLSLGLEKLPIELPLSTLTLRGTAQWSTLLSGSSLAGQPLVSVTWSQVVALDPRPTGLGSLTIGDIDWSGSLLRDLPLAAFTFGGAELTTIDLPGPGDPATKWCALLNAARAGSCTGPASLTGQTLISAGIGGADLEDLPLKSIPLKSIDLTASPLKSIPLKSIVLVSAPLKSIPLKSIDLAASPLKSIPLKSIDLAASPLKSIPLKSIDWQSSPLKSIPLKSIDLAASPLKSIPLKSIDWSVAGLGSLPVAAFTIPGSPLAGIPVSSLADAATVAGCAATTPSTCAADATLGQVAAVGDLLPGATLRAIGAAGFEAAGVTIGDLMAAITPGSGIEPTVGDLRIDRMTGPEASALLLEAVLAHLTGTELDALVLGDIGTYTTDTGHDITLGDLGTWTLPGGDITLGDLVAYLPDSISLADVLLGLIPASAFPYENFPFASLGLDAPLRSGVTPYGQVIVNPGSSADLSPQSVNSRTIPFANPSQDVPSAPTTVVFTLPAGARSMGVKDRESDVPTSDALDADGRHRVAVDLAAIPATGFTTLTVSWAPGALLQGQDLRIDIADQASGQQSSTTLDLPRVTDGQEPNTPLEYKKESVHFVPDAQRIPNLPVNPAGCRASDATCAGKDPVVLDALGSGHVSYAGDVDWFRIPDVRAGTRLSADLTNLPLDADLVLYGPSSISTSPTMAPPSAQGLPGALVEDPGLGVGQAARSLAVNDLAALRLDQGYEQTVPSGWVPAMTPLSISQHRQAENESVGAIAPVDGDYVVQVSGYNTETSPAPYVLRVRGITPSEATVCTPRSFAHPAPAPAAPPTLAPGVNTVFLTNPSRLEATFGKTAADAVATELQTTVDWLMTDHPELGIVPAVVPVDSSAAVQAAYDAWDANPCSVPAANAVTASITGLLAGLTSAGTDLRYLTVVGGDDLIPMGRVADLTRIANEAEYAATFVGVDNPLSASNAGGYTLTDDPYGDPSPTPLGNGDRLFVPEVSVGRLVETPSDIQTALAAYRQAQGRLDTSTALVSGYDFLSDGATATAARLAVGGRTVDDSLVDAPGHTPGWTSADLLAKLFPGGQAAPLVASINAHYDHRALLSAAGDATGGSDVVTDSQVAALAGSDGLAGRVLFTMGCHAGLSVPDAYVGGTAAVSTAGGWAQTLAQAKVAVYVANTGFGIGDSASIAYTERLMALYAKLLDGSMTVGQALTQAKQAYYGSLGAVGVYDTKILQQAAFYGLPFWQVGTAPAAPTAPAAATARGAAFTAAPAPALTVDATTGLDSLPLTLDPTLKEVSVAGGRYWTADDDDPQVTHLQPTQPRTSRPVGAPGLLAHGALIGALSSHDVTGVTPVVSTPVVDTTAAAPSVRAEDAAWPASIATITTYQTGDGSAQNLVLMPGQFTGSTHDGTGVQRLFDSVGLSVLYSPEANTDFAAPTISSATGEPGAGQVTFRISTVDPTPSGSVKQVRIGYQDTDGSWLFTDLSHDAADATLWSGSGPLTGSPATVRFFVQAVDAAGNVGVANGKVGGFPVSVQDITAPTITATITPAANARGWIKGTTATVTFTCTDGESGVADGDCPAPVEVLSEGSTSVTGTVRDRAGNSATTAIGVQLDGTPPVVTSTVTPGRWSNAASATVGYTCADAVSGLADPCPSDVTISAEGVTPVHQSVTDLAGNTTTVTDHVRLDRIAPSITASMSPAANAAGWVKGTSATVAFTCSDEGSGITTGACPAAVTVGEGVKDVSGSVADGAGNSATATLTAKVDGTAPTVTIVGTAPDLTCQTTDALSGVATAATGTTSAGATPTFTCSGATDVAGNAAPPVQTTFTATIGFSWYRSLTPPPGLNLSIRGTTVQGQFRLTQNGTALTTTSAVTGIDYRAVRCLPWAQTAGGWQTAGMATGGALTYNATASAFQFGWKSPRIPGCYELRVSLTDGTRQLARVILL